MRIRLQDFTKKFDGTTVIDRLNLDINDGEMLALLGPSGCGKSTTLLSISGIHRLDGGHILFGDDDVSELPSQKRNVGVVFQNYALYPHMTAYENIAFPLQVRHQKKAEIDRQVRDIAKLTHIEPYLLRKPAQLSGGQQQRVALARALVRRPDVLLLDEPLANLDAKLRLEMRTEIRRIQQETGITAILVTHDQVEAMSMADRIAIMNQGEILQIGSPTQLYRQPVNRFVASFMGSPPVVMLDGELRQGRVTFDSGFELPLPSHLQPRLAESSPISVGIRPEHFGAAGAHPVRGRICFVEPQGRETHVDLEVAPGLVLRSIQSSRTEFELGQEVEWPLDIEQTLVFDQHGNRL
ncbi:ABC transporter ATP-binding protein [Saccharospirillum mangrovi]|uniref:ABC transporter ATP-binding protein n=1 Tax=Saccharospirillum mangrovi TaxID=2161747 RepID=UPI000D3A9AAD|nr:ABC transporter ATP-binding protein [Saccharospirillum mangrovi]